jgi:hypothetical protein
LADELSHRAAGVWGPRFPAAHLNATLSDQFRHERLQIAAMVFALGHSALAPVARVGDGSVRVRVTTTRHGRLDTGAKSFS